MSEMGETFKAMRDESRERRARNRDHGARALADAGFKFESRNGGAHLLVDDPGGLVAFNYWPGTGRWSQRKLNGFGIESLLRHLLGRIRKERA